MTMIDRYGSKIVNEENLHELEDLIINRFNEGEGDEKSSRKGRRPSMVEKIHELERAFYFDRQRHMQRRPSIEESKEFEDEINSPTSEETPVDQTTETSEDCKEGKEEENSISSSEEAEKTAAENEDGSVTDEGSTKMRDSVDSLDLEETEMREGLDEVESDQVEGRGTMSIKDTLNGILGDQLRNTRNSNVSSMGTKRAQLEIALSHGSPSNSRRASMESTYSSRTYDTFATSGSFASAADLNGKPKRKTALQYKIELLHQQLIETDGNATSSSEPSSYRMRDPDEYSQASDRSSVLSQKILELEGDMKKSKAKYSKRLHSRKSHSGTPSGRATSKTCRCAHRETFNLELLKKHFKSETLRKYGLQAPLCLCEMQDRKNMLKKKSADMRLQRVAARQARQRSSSTRQPTGKRVFPVHRTRTLSGGSDGLPTHLKYGRFGETASEDFLETAEPMPATRDKSNPRDQTQCVTKSSASHTSRVSEMYVDNLQESATAPSSPGGASKHWTSWEDAARSSMMSPDSVHRAFGDEEVLHRKTLVTKMQGLLTSSITLMNELKSMETGFSDSEDDEACSVHSRRTRSSAGTSRFSKRSSLKEIPLTLGSPTLSTANVSEFVQMQQLSNVVHQFDNSPPSSNAGAHGDFLTAQSGNVLTDSELEGYELEGSTTVKTNNAIAGVVEEVMDELIQQLERGILETEGDHIGENKSAEVDPLPKATARIEEKRESEWIGVPRCALCGKLPLRVSEHSCAVQGQRVSIQKHRGKPRLKDRNLHGLARHESTGSVWKDLAGGGKQLALWVRTASSRYVK